MQLSGANVTPVFDCGIISDDNAKRDRKLKATEGRVLDELKRLKTKKYYEQPTLHSIVLEKRLETAP